MKRISSYFSKGRHRVPEPSRTKIKTAAVAATTGALLISSSALLPTHAGASELQGPPGGWGPVIRCESNGNPRAQNASSTASGLFQFVNGTWRSVGGTGRARDASAEEQHMRANILYAREGLRPWNASKSCWSNRVSSEPSQPIRQSTQSASARIEPGTGTGTYIVKRGDTLQKIAARNGTTWRALFNKNKSVIKNSNLIYVGQSITL